MSDLIGANTSQTRSALTDGSTFGLGDTRIDHQGNVWIYVQSSNSITQYDCVAIDVNFRAVQMSTDAVAKGAIQVGFAQVAFAPDEYGWVMKHGRPTIRVAADCQPSVPLYTTATGGVLDDAVTSQMIQGLVASNSVSGATASVAAVSDFPTVRLGATL